MKRFRLVLSVILVSVVALLAANYVAGQFSDPLEAASKECAHRGWKPQDLALLQKNHTADPFGSAAHVEFSVRSARPSKTLRLDLRKTINVLNWQIVDFREEAQ